MRNFRHGLDRNAHELLAPTTSVPTHIVFATPSPPAVLRLAAVVLVASSVPGIATLLLDPVPPMVRSVVAPASAVNVVLAVVMLVVKSGEVIACTPVNVCPASVRAMVAVVLGIVQVTSAAGEPASKLRT